MWKNFFIYIALVIILEGIVLVVYTRHRKTSRVSLREQSRCWRYFDNKYKIKEQFSDKLYRKVINKFYGEKYCRLEIEHANALISADLGAFTVSTVILGLIQLGITPISKVIVYMICNDYFLSDIENASFKIMECAIEFIIVLIIVITFYPAIKTYKKEKYFLNLTSKLLEKYSEKEIYINDKTEEILK